MRSPDTATKSSPHLRPTRESPGTATKTQRSQKNKTKKNNWIKAEQRQKMEAQVPEGSRADDHEEAWKFMRRFVFPQWILVFAYKPFYLWHNLLPGLSNATIRGADSFWSGCLGPWHLGTTSERKLESDFQRGKKNPKIKLSLKQNKRKPSTGGIAVECTATEPLKWK